MKINMLKNIKHLKSNKLNYKTSTFRKPNTLSKKKRINQE